MKPNFARQYTKTAPTKAAKRAALSALLTMRETLDGVDVDSLARYYGVPANDVRDMIVAEQKRRAA